MTWESKVDVLVTSTSLVLSSVSVAIQAAAGPLATLYSFTERRDKQHTGDDGGWEGDNFRLGDYIGGGDILGLSLMDNLALSDCEY